MSAKYDESWALCNKILMYMGAQRIFVSQCGFILPKLSVNFKTSESI